MTVEILNLFSTLEIARKFVYRIFKWYSKIFSVEDSPRSAVHTNQGYQQPLNVSLRESENHFASKESWHGK